MGGFGGNRELRRVAGLLGLVAGCLILANCSGNVARINPRWGVSASARVISPGQPIPKGGGKYLVGKPYRVAGHTYIPRVNNHYDKVGMASWYGDDFRGRYTANGEIFDQNAISAASPTLPLPSYARVTNLENHRSIVVRVNDRGPYVGNRLIDVSVKTAKLLGFYGEGVTKVRVEYVGRAPLVGSSNSELISTLRKNLPSTPRPVQVASARSYVPAAYFNPHSLQQKLPRRVPLPPNRPYDAGEANVATQTGSTPRQAQSTQPSRSFQLASANGTAQLQVSPVSAFARVRYDSRAELLSGRGIY